MSIKIQKKEMRSPEEAKIMSKENPGKPKSFLDDTEFVRKRREELFGRPWEPVVSDPPPPPITTTSCVHERDYWSDPCKKCGEVPTWDYCC